MIVKRIFDVVFSALILIISSPVILIGALAVKLSSKGPAIYRAKRAGLNGKQFEMLKLRTMFEGLDHKDQRITDTNDNRISPVGKVLRLFKIDELPQFWNVLKGEMSIVGPRPEDWEIVKNYYSKKDRQTLNVRPGISSLAAVTYYPDFAYHDPPPSDVSIQDWYLKRHLPLQIAEAFRYMEKQNLLFDLWVIGKTLYCVLIYSWKPPKQKLLSLNAR
jgi:lipopolysaccharide/colanic/teichoic acid biosynthesis glycosyltransferase